MNEQLNHHNEKNETDWDKLSDVAFGGSRVKDVDKAQEMAEAEDASRSEAARYRERAEQVGVDDEAREMNQNMADLYDNVADAAGSQAAKQYDMKNGKNVASDERVEDVDKAWAMAEAEARWRDSAKEFSDEAKDPALNQDLKDFAADMAEDNLKMAEGAALQAARKYDNELEAKRVKDVDKAWAMAEAEDFDRSEATLYRKAMNGATTEAARERMRSKVEYHESRADENGEWAGQEYDKRVKDVDKAQEMAEAEDLDRSQAAQYRKAMNRATDKATKDRMRAKVEYYENKADENGEWAGQEYDKNHPDGQNEQSTEDIVDMLGIIPGTEEARGIARIIRHGNQEEREGLIKSWRAQGASAQQVIDVFSKPEMLEEPINQE